MPRVEIAGVPFGIYPELHFVTFGGFSRKEFLLGHLDETHLVAGFLERSDQDITSLASSPRGKCWSAFMLREDTRIFFTRKSRAGANQKELLQGSGDGASIFAFSFGGLMVLAGSDVILHTVAKRLKNVGRPDVLMVCLGPEPGERKQVAAAKVLFKYLDCTTLVVSRTTVEILQPEAGKVEVRYELA